MKKDIYLMINERMKEFNAFFFEYDNIINSLYDYLSELSKKEFIGIEFNKNKTEYIVYNKIMDYSKQAFTNLVMGNIEGYESILRIIIENYIIIKGIHNGSRNIWKQYIIQSIYNIKNINSKNEINIDELLKQYFNESLNDITFSKEHVLNYNFLFENDIKKKVLKMLVIN